MFTDFNIILGRQLENGTFEKGFFDHKSWTETMGGWAKNVIVGRARIGGIPIGVIAVETRTTETRIPSDPADIDSKVNIMSNPGTLMTELIFIYFFSKFA